jgi:hypothetical protein
MADSSSSITPAKPPTSQKGLPIEYQVRPPNLITTTADSPLTGLAAHPFRPRSIWYELWKSKLAFFICISSSYFIYLDYQRTQRYKAEKALKAIAAEQKPLKK